MATVSSEMSRAALDDGGGIVVLVPPDARALRILRLVAADAGSRAGLDASEVDDLRIAVDELAQVLMKSASGRLVVRIVVQDAQVAVQGSARRRRDGMPVRLPPLAELIVDAVSDHYRIEQSETETFFVMLKTAGGAPSPW